MSVQSRTEARDILSARAVEALAAAESSLGEPIVVIWDDGEQDIPDTGVWARVSVNHNQGGQGAFGSGASRWQKNGILSIQVFTPVGGYSRQSDLVSDALEKTFEGKNRDPIWYTNAIAQEVGPDGAFSQTNFSVEFEYDIIH